MNTPSTSARQIRSKFAVRITHSALIVAAVLVLSCVPVAAQKKKATTKPKPAPAKPVDELARLREEFVNATKEYKANLEKLLASYEKSVAKAETRLNQSRELFAQGLISKNDVAV